jgi:hypothetical protein
MRRGHRSGATPELSTDLKRGNQDAQETDSACAADGGCVRGNQRASQGPDRLVRNGGVGSAHYHASYEGYDLGKDSDTGYQVNAGWRSRFIGFEGGYADLGSVDISDGAGDSLGASGKGWTLGLNGHFNPTDKWYISARAGFFFWNVDLRANLADGTGGSDSENGMNGYAGIGTGIDFNRHWSAGVNFDYYKINKHHVNIGTKLYSVTAEYRF